MKGKSARFPIPFVADKAVAAAQEPRFASRTLCGGQGPVNAATPIRLASKRGPIEDPLDAAAFEPGEDMSYNCLPEIQVHGMPQWMGPFCSQD